MRFVVIGAEYVHAVYVCIACTMMIGTRSYCELYYELYY
jgi:hypothetical protein